MSAHNSSPSNIRSPSPHMSMRGNADIYSQYLTDLLAEYHKLGPFMEVLPFSGRLLSQEILRISGKAGARSSHFFNDFYRLQGGSPSPTASSDDFGNFAGRNNSNNSRLQWQQGINGDLQSAQISPISHIVKKSLRVNANLKLMSWLLGPGEMLLKKVEAYTGCHLCISGEDSVKNLGKEELPEGRLGIEHIKEPLHILIEAELPVNMVDFRLRQAKELMENLINDADPYLQMHPPGDLAMLVSHFG